MTCVSSHTSTPRGGVASVGFNVSAKSAKNPVVAPSLLTRLYKPTNPVHVFVRVCTAISFSFSFSFSLSNNLPILYLRTYIPEKYS